ncbi:MAG TPA: polysaccharide deacetylase family protein [Desulfomonilia bacterium]|nr:polysaccharide deacetylase family protein [Desulfomonilia bacterium]
MPYAQRHAILITALIEIVLIVMYATQGSAYISILLYHRFDENRYPTTTTSGAQFEQHMAYLKSHGYMVLTMDQLADCVEGKRPVPDRGVVITIDDGFISEYEKAVPILRKYRFPFCIFIFTHAIDHKNYISWEQLRRLVQWGGEVGCHTYSHPRLINLPVKEQEKEVMGSKRNMEEKLGRPVRYFAYPYGEYDDSIRALARRAGFRLMLTTDPGSVGEGAEFDRIPRQAVVGAEMSLSDFIRKLMNPPLHVAARIPKSGSLPSDIITEVSVTLKDPQLYEPSQINLFLSEKKRLNARFDPRTGVLSCKGPFRLTRKTNRIIVSARRKSDGLFALDSCLIVLPGIWPDMRYTMCD